VTLRGDQRLEAGVDEEKRYDELRREILAAELVELEISLSNLRRTVNELQEIYKEDPDPVYKDAIEEDVELISKRERQIAKIRKRIGGVVSQEMDIQGDDSGDKHDGGASELEDEKSGAEIKDH
jgi:hypothetical protein